MLMVMLYVYNLKLRPWLSHKLEVYMHGLTIYGDDDQYHVNIKCIQWSAMRWPYTSMFFVGEEALNILKRGLRHVNNLY